MLQSNGYNMTKEPNVPTSEVKESGKYENLMDLADQNKQQQLENPDAFTSLFDVEEVEINPDHWTQHWKEMPEFVQEDNGPWKTVRIHFRNEEDYDEFAKLTGNTHLTKKTKSAWYPKLEITKNALLRWIEEDDDEDSAIDDDNNEGWQ